MSQELVHMQNLVQLVLLGNLCQLCLKNPKTKRIGGEVQNYSNSKVNGTVPTYIGF